MFMELDTLFTTDWMLGVICWLQAASPHNQVNTNIQTGDTLPCASPAHLIVITITLLQPIHLEFFGETGTTLPADFMIYMNIKY